MINDARFADALNKIDEANAQDPRIENAAGSSQPRELLFSRRVFEWVQKLVSAPSEELLLSARAHTLKRWEIPRDRYPKTTVGYHEWRDACAEHHADEAARILRNAGYDEEMIARVSGFITRTNWPGDAEACALEDADCLVFLETKLAKYLDEWDEEKTLRILKRSFKKMTPQARELAKAMPLDSKCRAVLARALA